MQSYFGNKIWLRKKKWDSLKLSLKNYILTYQFLI